jgi:glutamine synthetase
LLHPSRRLPFENDLPFFLVTFHSPDAPYDAIPPCPRSLLKRTVQAVRDLPATKGFEALAGVEYEYFQFKETPKSVADKKWTALEALTPGSESGCRRVRTRYS